MAKKKAKKAGKKRKPNAAFMKPMSPTGPLAAVVGSSAMPRTEVTKKIWGYIKRNGLQDKKNRRMINADDKLKAVFSGKGQVSMFEMTKLVSKHLKQRFPEEYREGPPRGALPISGAVSGDTRRRARPRCAIPGPPRSAGAAPWAAGRGSP